MKRRWQKEQAAFQGLTRQFTPDTPVPFIWTSPNFGSSAITVSEPEQATSYELDLNANVYITKIAFTLVGANFAFGADHILRFTVGTGGYFQIDSYDNLSLMCDEITIDAVDETNNMFKGSFSFSRPLEIKEDQVLLIESLDLEAVNPEEPHVALDVDFLGVVLHGYGLL